MFTRLDLFQGYLNRCRKHGKLNLDAGQFDRRNFLKARIFQRCRLRTMRDDLSESIFRRKLPNATAEPPAVMQGDERAAMLLQDFVVREILEWLPVSNGQDEGAPCKCQKQLLFAITE
jgi:hypothetical protein